MLLGMCSVRQKRLRRTPEFSALPGIRVGKFPRSSLDDGTYIATYEPGLEEGVGRLPSTKLLDPPSERRSKMLGNCPVPNN